MLPLAGPLIEDVLAAENAVFAEDEVEAPVTHALNGDGRAVPMPRSPRAVLDPGVAGKRGEVARQFLADQELAVDAELVADVLSGIVGPDALQSAVGLRPQPLPFPSVAPNPAFQA